MSEFGVVLNELLKFSIILFVGYLAAWKKILPKEYLPQLCSLITKILLPVYIFICFASKNTLEQLITCVPVIGLSIILYLIFIGVFFLLAKFMNLPEERSKVWQASFIFGNTAMIGIPLLAQLYSANGILYVAAFSIVDQIILWSYGIWLISGQDKQIEFSYKNFLNPALCSIALALMIIIFQIKIPDILLNTLGDIGRTSTPLCMLYFGSLFFYSRWKSVLRQKEFYIGVLVKMLLLPLIFGILLKYFLLPSNMSQTLIILSALPTMTVIPIFASAYTSEGDYATGIALLTIVLSMITLPLVIFIAF